MAKADLTLTIDTSEAETAIARVSKLIDELQSKAGRAGVKLTLSPVTRDEAEDIPSPPSGRRSDG